MNEAPRPDSVPPPTTAGPPADQPPPRNAGPQLPNSPEATRTIYSRQAWTVLLLVLVAGLVTDLASKYIAFNHVADRPVQVSREAVIEAQQQGRHLGTLIPPHEPVTVIPYILEFSLVLNPGAVFGIGAGKRWFFIVFTVGALALALWMFAAWTRPRDRVAHLGIGLLISGGLGNLYDRVVYACVRDFLHPLPGVRIPGTQRDLWPYVSNLADLWLLIGIAILMWHLWRHGKTAEETAGEAPQQSS